MSTAFGFGNGRNQSFYPATTLPVASRNQPSLPRVTAVDPREASNGSRMISFADKVRGEQPQHMAIVDLPTPEMKVGMPSIKLPKRALHRRLQYCKFCLVGRLDFHKIKIDEVRRIATEKWKPRGDWKLIPLGKGFFMIRLVSEEDLRLIWGGEPWKFGDQTLRLTKWTPDFNPEAQSASNALIWEKFPKLSQQYWDYERLMAMGKALGAPVGVDRHTIDRDFGFFVSVLVEIDLSKPIPPQIWVEEEDGISFIQEVEVVKMPKYCPHCKAVGHVMAEWKVLKKIRVEEEANNNEANEAQKQKTHRRKKRRKRGIGTKTEPIPEEVQTNHVEGIVHTTRTVEPGALVVHLDCSDLPSHIRIMTPLGETISVEGEVDNGVIPPDLVVSRGLSGDVRLSVGNRKHLALELQTSFQLYKRQTNY
ncbi:hypothetical protein IFM89_025318 [Coptis chinensis]|uniref:DUF4283 domain-containing protein n=1 Tax=Coptis chinensis TaxID=261450 RepID=A0A835HNM5_9MAGN|nr:hypothetical protein IFM89_025318 [Coptis chinensis]